MEKYIKMLILAAQIKVLEDLPHTTVYKSDDKLDGLTQKSATLMDDVLRVRNEKWAELAKLDGSKEIKKLKEANKELTELINKQDNEK